MREDNKSKIPSPTNKKSGLQNKPWFWPTVYAAIAVALIGLIFSYNALIGGKNDPEQTITVQNPNNDGTVIETNAQVETIKYPFDETMKDQFAVVQDYYDVTADEQTRENALLVFGQSFTASQGVSISASSEAFEVRAAMSGEVTKVKLDAFTGNQIIITHPKGMETRYSSVTDILVKEGDMVIQGQSLATTMENAWNPKAGIHLFFEVLQDGKHVNPNDFLAF